MNIAKFQNNICVYLPQYKHYMFSNLVAHAGTAMSLTIKRDALVLTLDDQ